MKSFFILFLITVSIQLHAQDNIVLKKHYEAYYKQMKVQADMQGVINALTHLNILSPSVARNDTLAYVYMSEGKYMQALNTIGIDKNVGDSDMAVEVKAVSLKSLKRSELAIDHFEDLFKRTPNVFIAYELADLNLQIQKPNKALVYINYGITNAKDDMKKAFYESRQPYQVSLKIVFNYLKALAIYNQDIKKNIDESIALLNEILRISPHFNLVTITKNELLRQKEALEQTGKESK